MLNFEFYGISIQFNLAGYVNVVQPELVGPIRVIHRDKVKSQGKLIFNL